MFRLFSKTISVTFVDQASGAPIARSDVPVEQLPDTFALHTTLELAGANYEVVKAEPETKAEFARTKQLVVSLRRLELLGPGAILFSLPTICGAALPRSGGVGGADVVVLHEDDWRQCEYVASAAGQDISEELSAVREIHRTARAEIGWRKVHVRERIVRPLQSGISWTDVVAQFRELEPVGGVAFGDRASAVSNAVAARLPADVAIWGVEEGGELAVLCVEGIETAAEATVEGLKRVADAHSLVLVHWCRCQAYFSAQIQVANAIGLPWQSST